MAKLKEGSHATKTMSQRIREATKTQRDLREEDSILNDMVDVMDDIGRSQSQQLLELAKASKNQAANESKAYIDEFESRVTTRRDDIMRHITEIIDQMQRETDIRALTASMLLVGDATASRQRGNSSTKSMAQPATESILSLFKRFIAQYDDAECKESTNGRSLPVKPRGRDEEILEELLRSQHERARQRVSNLLHGTTDPSSEIGGELIVRPTSDTIWSALTAEPVDGAGNINEQERYSWNRINESARRGVRRLVKNLPEGSET